MEEKIRHLTHDFNKLPARDVLKNVLDGFAVGYFRRDVAPQFAAMLAVRTVDPGQQYCLHTPINDESKTRLLYEMPEK